jgi:hypothetical protein
MLGISDVAFAFFMGSVVGRECVFYIIAICACIAASSMYINRMCEYSVGSLLYLIGMYSYFKFCC